MWDLHRACSLALRSVTHPMAARPKRGDAEPSTLPPEVSGAASCSMVGYSTSASATIAKGTPPDHSNAILLQNIAPLRNIQASSSYQYAVTVAVAPFTHARRSFHSR